MKILNNAISKVTPRCMNKIQKARGPAELAKDGSDGSNVLFSKVLSPKIRIAIESDYIFDKSFVNLVQISLSSGIQE
jgi:hypothetical protein